MTKIKILFSLVTLLVSSAFAEVSSLIIPAKIANSEAQEFRGAHQAYWDPSSAGGRMLLVSLGGTHSLPSDFTAFNHVAVSMGLDVIALDYDNHVISTSCKNSKDLHCFDKFRHEVTSGEGASDLLKISKANSIEQRLLDTLRVLSKNDPRWKAYLLNDQINWSQVVMAGHSQGSGHAAYLAKQHDLKAVLMLAGPQDTFADGKTAPWVHAPSKTPVTAYISFLHRRDFFNSELQIQIAKQLTEGQHPANILITDQEVSDPHMSVIQPLFSEQWRWMIAKVLLL